MVKGEIPNLLLAGPPGVGKTTIAKALCNEIGADYYVINGSDEGRFLDTVRNQAKNFASTMSLTSKQSTKSSLLMRQTTQVMMFSCCFAQILRHSTRTAVLSLLVTTRTRLLEPSTVVVLSLSSVSGKEKQEVAAAFFKRLKGILEQEKIDADQKVLAQLVQKHFPDFRRVLNEVQRYSSSGKIDSGILATFSEVKVDDLIGHLKSSNFTEVRKWVVSNLDNDANTILRKVYDAMYSHLEGPSVPLQYLSLLSISIKVLLC